jgi:SAM-dependent methyltransferase
MKRRVALAILRRAYAGAQAGARLHVLGRFVSCPILPVIARLPGRGRLLDLGAGHGAFALLAVASRGVESAVALEPDFRKLLACARVRAPRLGFVAGYTDALRGRFAVVSVLDVLYRLPAERWDEFLSAAHDALEPGGVLLLKEIDPTHRLKGGWNRLQERGADLLGLTLGDAFSYEPPVAMTARLARLGFRDVETVDLGAWYPHAHVLYVARRPSGEAPEFGKTLSDN